MATAEITDACLLQIHNARTQLQACFRRAHEILTDREADLLRQLNDIQTSYEQETKSREEEIQDLEKSKRVLKTSVHDNDTLNKALAPLTDKLEQILRLASAARTVKFQWNTAFDEELQLTGEIIASVPSAVIPHSNLTHAITKKSPFQPQKPVIPQTSISQPNLRPITKKYISQPKLKPVAKKSLFQPKEPQMSNNIFIPDYRNKFRPVISCCEQGIAPGQLSWPRGLAIELHTGRIYIADSGNNRVQVYSPDGEYFFMFGSYMNRPWSICINSNTVYVCQVSSHCITLYTLDGKYLNTIGSDGTSNGKFKYPTGIAVSATSEHLYVCDADNNRVQIFNKNLNFHSKFGNNTLKDPKDIKLSNDSVIVLDAGNPCIHIFSITNCSLLNSIISRGSADAQIGNSDFFSMDAELNFILTDDRHDCIKVFSNTGHFITQIGKEGHAIGEFVYPNGIAIDRQNRIIVISGNKSCSLQIF